MNTVRISPARAAMVALGLAASPVLAQSATPLKADLAPTQGNKARGVVTFAPASGDKVSVQVRLSRLPKAGEYGLHIHQVGDCSAPDGKSAGDHFNPLGKNHGDRKSIERHAGDLGNVTADARGEVSMSFDVEGINLDKGEAGIAGRSVILHGNADDLKSQPAGNSGPRIACGVIGAKGKAPG